MSEELQNDFAKKQCERWCDRMHVCATYELLKSEKMLRHLHISICKEFKSIPEDA